MAYSNFTSLTKFCKQYHLQQNTLTNLFENSALPEVVVSKRSKEELQELQKFPLYTEKAKLSKRLE